MREENACDYKRCEFGYVETIYCYATVNRTRTETFMKLSLLSELYFIP